MQEFMLFIKTTGDHLAHLSPQEQQAHVQKIGNYIGGLMNDGKLVGAQPLEMGGAVVQGNKGSFKDGPFTESKEVIVGYFHIKAASLEEAVAIAKANPIFEDTEATMEIRPIKKMDGIN
ncbi:YciI family protein [Marinoscillum sp. MHG1-6]|uniref:YciI family protein n=1 Tax=Marinoscillum sp. MHG1-6 TaxID=2959627 RepID=UPI002156FCE1|nr:YciI family protein [Marinoscillum sp. MHG1-6]